MLDWQAKIDCFATLAMTGFDLCRGSLAHVVEKRKNNANKCHIHPDFIEALLKAYLQQRILVQIYVVSRDREINTVLLSLIVRRAPQAMVSFVVQARHVQEVAQPGLASQVLLFNACDQGQRSNFTEVATLRNSFPFAPIVVLCNQFDTGLKAHFIGDLRLRFFDANWDSYSSVNRFEVLIDNTLNKPSAQRVFAN